jgi:hypothetical protein
MAKWAEISCWPEACVHETVAVQGRREEGWMRWPLSSPWFCGPWCSCSGPFGVGGVLLPARPTPPRSVARGPGGVPLRPPPRRRHLRHRLARQRPLHGDGSPRRRAARRGPRPGRPPPGGAPRRRPPPRALRRGGGTRRRGAPPRSQAREHLPEAPQAGRAPGAPRFRHLQAHAWGPGASAHRQRRGGKQECFTRPKRPEWV